MASINVRLWCRAHKKPIVMTFIGNIELNKHKCSVHRCDTCDKQVILEEWVE